MEILLNSLFCDLASSENFSGHPGFESEFNGHDGIATLLERLYVPDENCSENTDVKPEPALPFNPLAPRAATISLSAIGAFGFNFFNGKGKKQNRKANNLDQSHKKPNKPDQNSMKEKGGNPPSHEASSDEWLENGQCPLASYQAMSGILPLVAKALQPPAGMKLKCPPAIVAAQAALARTTLVKTLLPQPLPAKMVAIAMLEMAANVPLGVWREHTKKFSPQWFAAVHAAVPFITMLRKSVNMPRTAMMFNIAAAILGQTIGSRAEHIRLKALAEKTAAGPATIDAAMYPNIASTSRRRPSNVSRFKPFKPPQSKVTAASKASVKHVSLNVSSCSGVTVNFNSGAANTKFNGQQADKRARKIPNRLLE